MGKIYIINGSARPQSVGSAVSRLVLDRLVSKDAVAEIIDLKEQNLPFFDAATPPSAEGYVNDNPAVKDFTKKITDASGVVFVTPEYNHALSAIMKNALDTLYKEWRDKPAAFVGYGWYAAKHSHANFLEINSVLKLDLGDAFTGLTFMKELNTDGSLIDEKTVQTTINATLDELLEKIKGRKE